jgi:hypothetical protein
MKRTLISLLLLSTANPLPMQAEYRVWKDTQGHAVEAEFVRVSGEQVHLKRKDTGKVIPVTMVILSKEDQDYLLEKASGSKTVKIAEAIRKVDAAVETGLAKHGLQYNEPLNEYMFVRRVYADLAGRIPTFQELTGYVKSQNPQKPQLLVSKLIGSEDYVSHNFNFMADLLRIQSKVPGTSLRTDAFIYWLKEQIRNKRPFDDMVEEMVTAEGRIWENPAVGYHLRDNAMKLDHVSFMTKVFLGTDISCAQCHDDPFQDWTQYEYYELTAFLADLDTQENLRPNRAKMSKDPKLRNFNLEQKKLKEYFVTKYNLNPETRDDELKLRRLMAGTNRNYREILGANQLVVYTKPNRDMRLPEDYQYDDAKPEDIVQPRFIFLEEEAAPKSSIPERKRLSTWLVSQQNPRFAESIANLMWNRFFGRGVAEPLHNWKEEEAYNTELLKVLGHVIRELDFDLRAFSRVIVGTKAYNTLATRTKKSEADAYYFSGPILRRMTAEQVWDSLLTLMMDDPLQWKAGKGEQYNEIINMMEAGPPKDIPAVLQRVQKYRKYSPNANLFNSSGMSYAAISGPSKKSSGGQEMDEDMAMMMKSAGKSRLVLARASELEQPAPVGHFLSKFGQSERNFVVGAASDEGSVPQVMELMNGAATMVLTQPNSIIFQNLKSQADPMEQAEVVFLSILNRRMLPIERKMLVDELQSGGNTAIANLIWALLNTPEFLFVK